MLALRKGIEGCGQTSGLTQGVAADARKKVLGIMHRIIFEENFRTRFGYSNHGTDILVRGYRTLLRETVKGQPSTPVVTFLSWIEEGCRAARETLYREPARVVSAKYGNPRLYMEALAAWIISTAAADLRDIQGSANKSSAVGTSTTIMNEAPHYGAPLPTTLLNTATPPATTTTMLAPPAPHPRMLIPPGPRTSSSSASTAAPKATPIAATRQLVPTPTLPAPVPADFSMATVRQKLSSPLKLPRKYTGVCLISAYKA